MKYNKIEKIKEWKESKNDIQSVITELCERDLELKGKIQELIERSNQHSEALEKQQKTDIPPEIRQLNSYIKPEEKKEECGHKHNECIKCKVSKPFEDQPSKPSIREEVFNLIHEKAGGFLAESNEATDQILDLVTKEITHQINQKGACILAKDLEEILKALKQ